MSKRITYLSLGILTGVTMASGAALVGSSTYADVAKDVAVTVSDVCGFKAADDEDERTVIGSPSAGASVELPNITTTVFCNTAGGFSVYAVGYTNDVEGTTTLNDTNSNTIATGTSGTNSYWAVKYAPVAGDYAPSVVTAYRNYNVIPSTRTPVVTLSSTTDKTVGASFTTTYKVYASTSQAAGTYTGQVLYTLSAS